MSIFSKFFNTEKEESPALTKEQKQIEKKFRLILYGKLENIFRDNSGRSV